MFIQIIGSLQLGLLYAAIAMGVFVTFRILDIADLTVDGSFVTGMATAAVVTIAANNPVLGNRLLLAENIKNNTNNAKIDFTFFILKFYNSY